jgi:hypothetical protein
LSGLFKLNTSALLLCVLPLPPPQDSIEHTAPAEALAERLAVTELGRPAQYPAPPLETFPLRHLVLYLTNLNREEVLRNV